MPDISGLFMHLSGFQDFVRRGPDNGGSTVILDKIMLKNSVPRFSIILSDDTHCSH